MRLSFFWDLGLLPPFNPDREPELYEGTGQALRYRGDLHDPGLLAVRDLNERLRRADALLIACPEYARGIPGAFKNALDWAVGSDALVRKPFAQFNASPRASHAQAALRLTLETMSGRIVEEACIAIPLLSRGLTAAEIVTDDTLAAPIRRALSFFASWLENDADPR